MGKKEQLIGELQETRDQLLEVLNKFSEDEWKKELQPGKWSLLDLVVHITHWNRWGLNRYKYLIKEDELPKLRPIDVDLVNKRIGEAWALHPLFDIKADLQYSFEEVINFLKDLPESMYEKNWRYGEKETNLCDWFHFAALHEKEHAAQLRKLKRE